MDISFIILNYKSKGLLRNCLRSIMELDWSGLRYEIIVVDNDSRDGVKETLGQNFAGVILIESPKNLGMGAGNNLGVKQARGEYLVVLNPDTVALAGAVNKMYDFMAANPQIGLVGPKLINPDGSLQYSTYKFPSFWLPLFRRTFLGNIPALNPWLKDYQMMAWDHKEARAVDWLLGACLIVRRQAVEEVGLMDEQFFLYVEDTDWCRRFWASKWEVWYVASVELVHFHERLSAQKPLLSAVFSKITWIHISSWFKYFQKWK